MLVSWLGVVASIVAFFIVIEICDFIDIMLFLFLNIINSIIISGWDFFDFPVRFC